MWAEWEQISTIAGIASLSFRPKANGPLATMLMKRYINLLSDMVHSQQEYPGINSYGLPLDAYRWVQGGGGVSCTLRITLGQVGAM